MVRGRGPISRRATLSLLAIAIVGGMLAWRLVRHEPRRAPGMDVLLVTIDTLRADALGCYGKTTAVTPRIDRLAASGVRFDFAHAHNVVTLPSHANILAGRYPFDHGVRENSGFRFPAALDTLATLLKQRGYHTGAFVSAFPLDSRFGLDRGFDVYDDRLGDVEAGADFEMQERAGARTVAAARAWLDATPQPRFCWVHLYDPHAPYAPPFAWQDRVPSAYDGEVTAVDEALAPLLDPLLAPGTAEDALVVFTADHGEGLGDHGEATHGVFAYESTLRVPLVLRSGRLFAPRVVGESARHVDILPTVLDALGLAIPAGLPGRSLLALAQGESGGGAPDSYFESLTPALTRGWAPIHGVLRDRLKFIELPLPELYDLAPDPREETNLFARRPEVVTELRTLLGTFAAGSAVEKRGESAEARERLRSLGYLGTGGGGRTSYTESDDPKKNIGFENDLQRSISLFMEGDVSGARALGEALVRRHPKVPLGLRHLSFLRARAGDFTGAVAAARGALAADPESVEALSELGRLLNDAGRPKETVALLAPRASQENPDLDVLLTYGIALAQAGQKEPALAALRQARRADPSNTLAACDLGTALLMFGDRTGARTEFEAALRIDPDLSRAQSSLGTLAALQGNAEEAVRLWRHALERNPRDWDTLLNLGTLLTRQGRGAEATPYLERFLAGAPPARYGQDLAAVKAQLAGGRPPRS